MNSSAIDSPLERKAGHGPCLSFFYVNLFAGPVTRNQRETITSSAVLGFSSAPKDRNTNEVRVPS